MAIAVPLGIGIAVFLTELCPPSLRRPIGNAIELLAIPSIIYGIWGLFVFAPFLQTYLQPFFIEVFSNVPVLNSLFAGPPYGIGILTASLILAIMVDPFVDRFRETCSDPRRCCRTRHMSRLHNLGSHLERRRSLHPLRRHRRRHAGARPCPGRNDGGDLVIGNAHKISGSLLAPGTTISASIANEFTEAVGDVYTSSLIALGLILFMITFVVLAIARIMLMRLEIQAGR